MCAGIHSGNCYQHAEVDSQATTGLHPIYNTGAWLYAMADQILNQIQLDLS